MDLRTPVEQLNSAHSSPASLMTARHAVADAWRMARRRAFKGILTEREARRFLGLR